MKTKIYRPACWPTPEQELLLRAAVLSGNEARQAWSEWKARADVERLDPGSRRLLPLLYLKLRAEAVHDPLLEPLKTIYRDAWGRNRLLFHNMAALLRRFAAAGIRTILLKGAPLVLLYYKDYGARPMSDFDVLVRTDDGPAAFALLKRSGWTPLGANELSANHLALKHGASFRDGAGREFDLHWHLLPEFCQPGAERDLWEAAVPLDVEGVATCTLAPADLLLHVCAHGVKWNELPPLRWVADAMAIIHGAEIDWERLAAQAQKRRMIWPIKEALGYLRDNFRAPIPPGLLSRLRQMPTTRMEAIEYRYRTEGHRKKLFGHLPALWMNYARAADQAGTRCGLLAFLRYLQAYWEADRPAQLFRRALVKSVRRMRAAVSAYRMRRSRLPDAKR